MSKETEESYQKAVRKLGDSFDTIEIPRKVLSSARNTVEKSSGKEMKSLEVPLYVDKTRRNSTNIEQEVLPESFDIVDIPRRGTTFERNDITFVFPNDIEITKNASHKSWLQLEDVPIKVSDVSTYFPQKLLPIAIQPTPPHSPNSTESLCKLSGKEFQELSESSYSEDTMDNLAKFKKRFVDLTCESILLSDLRDDIEKTHLSLINTPDDESEMVRCPPEIDIPPNIETEISPSAEEPLKPIASVCRKCQQNRLSATQNDTTIESFVLEPLPVYKMDLNALQELENKLKLGDVFNFWHQQIRVSDSFNVSDGNQIMTLDDDVSLDSFLSKLQNERLVNAKQRKQKRNEIKTDTSFVHKVWNKIQSKPDWTLNALLLGNNILKLTHARIRTFAIFMDFKPKDIKGIEGEFREIQLVPNYLHYRQWKPFEYALHYQLLVELPFDPKKICPTSEYFFQFLDHVENVTQDFLRTCKGMLSITLASPACLIREPSGSLYIRKYVRTKTPQNEVKRTEIHIEVRNIKKLSYESIIMPPLYEFDEKIKLLPEGHTFLKIFLDDPLKFMKI